MSERAGLDLICLIDPDSGVRLRVLGRHRPGDTPYHDCLDAELVITSAFVGGRLRLCLTPEAMDDWAAALHELSSGQDVIWRVTYDTEIRIAIDRRFSASRPVVTVDDSTESDVSVRVVLDPGDDWVESLRGQFAQVRQAWPNEGVTTPRARSYWQ